MTSASKSPALNGIVSSFLPSNPFAEENFFDDKQLNLVSKSKSLNNITSDKSASPFRNTISMREDQAQGSNGHHLIENEQKESFSNAMMNLPPRGSNFSPEIEINDVNSFKQTNILKEQTNYPLFSDSWSGLKRSRTAIEQTIEGRKDYGLDETQCQAERHEQYFHHVVSPDIQQKLGTQRENATTSHSFRLPFHKASVDEMPALCKSYNVIAPQSHASDIVNVSVNMRDTSVSHNLHSVKWDARHNEQLSGKFYNGKKYQEQCASGKLSEAKQLNDRAIAAMNANALSASSAIATDLSQHSINNNAGVLHRDESINNKVYPHLFLPAQQLDQRLRETHEQPVKSSRGEFILQNQVDGKDDKKFNINGFKPSVWSGFGPPTLFTEQQQGMQHQQTPYESNFYPECNPNGMHHPASRHYDPNLLVKQEGSQVQHGSSIPITWDKTTSPFDRMIGSIYKPDRNQCYLKPPPVDLDDVSTCLLTILFNDVLNLIIQYKVINAIQV